jgi:hypothetical protein
MNEKKYLLYLKQYHQWLTAHQEKATEELAEREALSKEMQKFDKRRLLNMTANDVYNLLSPLWALGMWGNKHYKIDSLIETNGLDLIRSQFANLLYGNDPLAKRWDEFRQKIKGVGPGIMSEILNKAFPDECILWNNKIKNGFSILEIPNTPKYDSAMDGKMYTYLSDCGKKMLAFAKSNGYNDLENLIALDYFIWQEVQKDIDEPVTVDVVEAPKNKKESRFVHNDIRDKIKDIGECLGFKATTEVNVANGARVDAVWEVSIGNMGRIIYVFEVQTSGSIDSLILNLMKAKNNKAVQGIVAVSDAEQIEKIRKEVESLDDIKKDIKYWDYTEVLEVHEALQKANESINKLGLVPMSL